jgi:hypothetical protein
MTYIVILALLIIVFFIANEIRNAPLIDENKKVNPYKWIYYKEGWSQNQINENNKKYWDWEKKHNDFVPPNNGLKKTVKINQKNNI